MLNAYNYLVTNGYTTVLNNNLYMSSTLEYQLRNSSGNIVPNSLYVANTALLLKPEGRTLSPAHTYTENGLTPGQTYYVWAQVTSNDVKCPILGTSGFQPTGLSITAPSAPIIQPITGTLTASPGIVISGVHTITEGHLVTLSWTTNANTCDLYLSGTGFTSLGLASGSKELSLQDLQLGQKKYDLICSNADFTDVIITNINVSVIPKISLNLNSTPNDVGNEIRCYKSDGINQIPCNDIPVEVSSVVLKAIPSSTHSFLSWNGCPYSNSEQCIISSIASHAATPITANFMLDADKDGWDDINSAGNGHDLCPNDLRGSQYIYQGCPYEYSIKPGTTCQQVSNDCYGIWPFEFCYSAQTSFNEATNTFNCRSDYPSEDYFAKANSNNCDLFNLEGNPNCGDLNIMSLSGSGRYVCVNSNSGDDKVVGYCDLRFNGNINVGCNVNGIFIPDGQMKDIYKYKKVLKVLEEENTFFEGKKRVYCSNGLPIINGDTAVNTLLTDFRFVGAKILSGPEYDNLIRDPLTGELKINDTITIGKLSCDSTDDTCSLKVNSTSTIDVNLTTIPQTRTKEITIIKDGTNIRNDTIDISLIAMQAHKIQRFTSDEAATSFIAKSYYVMTKFDITKNLTYNSVTNKTTVKLQLNNIPESDKKNLTLYMLVDKEIANSLEDISNIQKGNAEFFVVDKDPIIGWYFNESGSDEEIGYTVPGESEGGTVIITQTPILYNEGELIINYRETDCTLDELTLFELDNLIDSKVYAAGSSQLYKVCLTHLDSNVNLALGSGIQSIDVMSYINTQNASSNPDELTTKITLSTDNSSQYWDVRVQKENPSGNYSCIGSLDLINESSLFGDCGYNEDARVWIHLGADYNAPETTLSYPSLAHTLKVTLTAFEPTWESGVKNLSYRVIEDNESFTTVEDDTVSFIVTCPNDWNCKKTVEYFAYDNAENKEETKTRELLLIDKGSACQADCTAKPSPNRYLKECTNLNSCEFYQFNEFGINDGGDYVANQCDYLAIGSWATYNETHELLCPKGPFRESKFTNTRVNAIDESNCENILKTPYPVIFDGENIIMNIISCINYEE